MGDGPKSDDRMNTGSGFGADEFQISNDELMFGSSPSDNGASEDVTPLPEALRTAKTIIESAEGDPKRALNSLTAIRNPDTQFLVSHAVAEEAPDLDILSAINIHVNEIAAGEHSPELTQGYLVHLIAARTLEYSKIKPDAAEEMTATAQLFVDIVKTGQIPQHVLDGIYGLLDQLHQTERLQSHFSLASDSTAAMYKAMIGERRL